MIIYHQGKVVCFEDMGQLLQIVCQVHLRVKCKQISA